MKVLQQTPPSPSLPKRYTNTLSQVRVGWVGSSVSTTRSAIGPRPQGGRSHREASWLLREFDTLRQIRHENLIRVFDCGALPSGEAYYTMELVEGGDWGTGFDKPQGADRVQLILQGVGRALAHLHSHGETHGDLKPGNVLLAMAMWWLTDVGMGSSARTDQHVSGTPGMQHLKCGEGAAVAMSERHLFRRGDGHEAVAGRHPSRARRSKML
jgi:serine/threonine protein kinase